MNHEPSAAGGLPERPSRMVLRNDAATTLADRGVFMFTIPVGFNPVMDRHLDSGAIRPDEHFCLQRISAENDWVQIGWDEAKKSKHMALFHCANALYFGISYGRNHSQRVVRKG